ncbi:unnamed protein product [Closterium sp. NIES-64]|nr:unnamed protein product [Closterium sp. NIES-64]
MNLPGEIEEFLSRFLGYEGFRFHLRRYLLFATLFALIIVGYVSSVAHHSANLTARYGYDPDAPQIAPLVAEDDAKSDSISQDDRMGKTEEKERREEESDNEEPEKAGSGAEGWAWKEAGTAGEARIGSETGGEDQDGEGGRAETGARDAEGGGGRKGEATGEGNGERKVDGERKGEGGGESTAVPSESSSSLTAAAGGGGGARRSAEKDRCAVEQGTWKRDNTYPLYASTCPYIESRFACTGRPFFEFAQYRWQPAGCLLPRIDAGKLLSSFRDKHVVFAGDAVAKQASSPSSSSSTPPASPSSVLYRVSPKAKTAARRATRAEKEAMASAGAEMWRSANENVTFVFFPSDYLVTSIVSTTTATTSSSGKASTVRVFLNQLGPWHEFAEQHADLLVLHAAAAFSHNAFLPTLATASPYYNTSNSSSSSKEQRVVFLNGTSPAHDSSEAAASSDSLSAFRSALRTFSAWARSTPRLKNIPVFFLSTPGHHFASSKDPAVPRYKNIWKAKWSGKAVAAAAAAAAADYKFFQSGKFQLLGQMHM